MEKGDTVTVRCEVTKVLADGLVVIRLPGVDTPVMISDQYLALTAKAKKGTEFKVPRGWKPPRDVD